MMELTQRLECTQELFTNCEKTHPEQIGFLGICGAKYPLRKGPNKIGRDPETCNIVLNLTSISRQHAVINILNSHDFMLMDLDSANKTKLSNKTLQPYIPLPLKNGDMVQFGEVFGVFRLCQEENDLPMTQAIDIPDTPVQSRLVSKLNSVHVTTIPESPEVSDRDDSFIAASQQKPKNTFKSPNNKFLKASGKTIEIKPFGTNKIDNVYWSSSKKSDSFSMQSNVSNNNLDDLVATPPKQSIHEMDTQVPVVNKNESTDSIYNATTQIVENLPCPDIYEMETQLPTTLNLQKVCKMQDQQNLEFNFCADNKENDNNIFNAETQAVFDAKPLSSTEKEVLNNMQRLSNSKESLNVSNDVILFDEIDSQPELDNFESQPLLADDRQIGHEDHNSESEKIKFVSRTRINRLKSDSSTDCEDINIAVTQKILKNTVNDDVSTDCEDETDIVERTKNQRNDIDDDITDCEDDLNDDVIEPNKPVENDNFEDLPTQILEDPKTDDRKEITNRVNKENISIFEEAPTQIIVDNKNNTEKPCTSFEEALTQQVYSEEVVKFKVPFQSPVKKKKTNDANLNISKKCATEKVDDDDDKYYAATQELLNDLCSQRPLSPDVEIVSMSNTKFTPQNVSIEERPKFMTNKNRSTTSSSDSCDIEERINEFVSNLSSSQIREVVGVPKPVDLLKKVPSDGSDVEATPKKINCLSVLETDLPNTQEIKTGISLIPDNSDKESLDDNFSESETDSERSSTLIKSKHKPRKLQKIKINLSDKFDPETLPTRTSTRVRKATSKLRNCDDFSINIFENDANSKPNVQINENLTKVDKIPVKDSKHRREKSIKIERKVEDHELNTTKNGAKANNARKVEKEEKSEKNTSGRRKHKDDTHSDKQKKEKITVVVVEETNKEKKSANNSSRSTRSKQNSKKSKSPEIEKPKSEIKSKDKNNRKSVKEKSENEKTKSAGSRKQTKEVEEFDSETEVRRSKRNRNATKKSDDLLSSVSKPKTKSPINHEQSTVYSIVNVSSDSGTDSPNKLKRQATSVLEVPSAKKARATPARRPRTHFVLFTAFPSEEVKEKLERLGAVVVSDVMACTVVLTIQIKRTFKLLCAVGLGKPIVGPNWVQACVDTNMIVDPWLYLIKDEATEKRFKFDLQMSLSGKRDFLRGFNVSSTPSVMPAAPEMKLIVECSGGRWKEGGPNWVCVSVPADRALWAGLKRRGAVVVSTEFILGGVLIQKLDIERNKLA